MYANDAREREKKIQHESERKQIRSVEYALREITKGKMSTKFMSMKLDYVSCDFTLLNCFVVKQQQQPPPLN